MSDQYVEGDTVVNPDTGERHQLTLGKWVPIAGDINKGNDTGPVDTTPREPNTISKEQSIAMAEPGIDNLGAETLGLIGGYGVAKALPAIASAAYLPARAAVQSAKGMVGTAGPKAKDLLVSMIKNKSESLVAGGVGAGIYGAWKTISDMVK